MLTARWRNREFLQVWLEPGLKSSVYACFPPVSSRTIVEYHSLVRRDILNCKLKRSVWTVCLHKVTVARLSAITQKIELTFHVWLVCAGGTSPVPGLIGLASSDGAEPVQVWFSWVGRLARRWRHLPGTICLSVAVRYGETERIFGSVVRVRSSVSSWIVRCGDSWDIRGIFGLDIAGFFWFFVDDNLWIKPLIKCLQALIF